MDDPQIDFYNDNLPTKKFLACSTLHIQKYQMIACGSSSINYKNTETNLKKFVA